MVRQLIQAKVNHTRKCNDAGLDFGDQCTESDKFLHLDTILVRFCKDIIDFDIHTGETKVS